LRRRAVSSIAYFMESVTLSAYIITLPWIWRAARPAIWISETSLRRNPSLSASSTITSETSGRSNPSRNRFTPITQSYFLRRRSRRISTRSNASNSEWM